jgi:hypothetical protein
MRITTPITTAALAALALALGACGSGSGQDGDSAGSREDRAFQGALKFAKCMRDEGVDMPDPQRQAGGGIVQKMGGEGAPLNQAKVEAAQKKCEHFMDAGGGSRDVDPKEEAEHRDQLLAYAKCMRQHGVPMKDPKFSGNKVQLSIGGGPGDGGPRINPESATFKAAEKACRPLQGKIGAGPAAVKK